MEIEDLQPTKNLQPIKNLSKEELKKKVKK